MRLNKKSMQAMETETPIMLLFVCNGTDHSSISADMRQILDIAYQDLDEESMMPEQYENRDIPKFAIRLNVPRLPKKKSVKDNKSYDHMKDQGKKAFHLEVAKSDLAFFTFLANHAHRTGLDTKYFGKFAKLTATLGKDAPLSDCARLRRCIQGHLNFHLSSTSIAIHGIEDLDASEIVRNPTTGARITRVSLRDMLYKIMLSNNSPLFLQLSQCSSGEVDAVIPNTPEAKNMAEQINVQVAAWCHFYWKDTNKGGERFFKKLAEHAFNGHLIHEISECTWDPKEKAVTSPRSQSEMSAVYEFESLDWVQNILQAESQPKKKHVDPLAASTLKMTSRLGLSTAGMMRFLPGRLERSRSPPMTRSASFLLRHRTASRPRVEPGLPPVPCPQQSAYPPRPPPPERQGLSPSPQRDLRSLLEPARLVVSTVGRVANSCQ